MAELNLNLDVETGRTKGTRSSRRMRRDGKIPGIVYGLGGDPVSIAVDFRELRQVLTTAAGLNALIDLKIDGGDHQLSIVKDLQRHPFRSEVLHVDFLRLDADTPIEVEVPVLLTGEADQITAEDGMVDQNLFSLRISAKPADIPNEVVVDISQLTVGDSIRVSDLVLPAGVVIETDLEDAVASGTVTRSTIEMIEADAATEAEAAEEGEAGAEGEDTGADDGTDED